MFANKSVLFMVATVFMVLTTAAPAPAPAAGTFSFDSHLFFAGAKHIYMLNYVFNRLISILGAIPFQIQHPLLA